MSTGTQVVTHSQLEAELRKLGRATSVTWLGSPGSSVKNFIELNDCPPSYAGAAGALPSVNTAENRLVFNPYILVDETVPILTIRNMTDAAVDPIIQFAVGATPVVKYTMGVDDSDADNAFRLDKGAALGANLVLYSGGTNAIFGESACLNVTMVDIANNVILGYRACQYTGMTPFIGDGNVIIGADAALYAEGDCYDNVILGHETIQYIADFSYGNVLVGAHAGFSSGGGLTRSILLGYSANTENDRDNVIAIGANVTGSISDTCVIGRRWGDTNPDPVVFGFGTWSPQHKFDIWHAGIAKSITSLVRLVNPVNAPDMDGTGVGVLFGLQAYGDSWSGVYYDATHIVAVAEKDWLWTDDGFGNNADIATIDSYLGFYTSLGGVMAEKARITSIGNLDIVGAYFIDGIQVVSNRVVDVRIDDAINTSAWDATTAGVLDAIRDAMITHGLIAPS